MNPTQWLMAASLVALIGLSAFFSSAETAYSAANHIRLKKLDADGVEGADRALRLLEDYDRLLTTILVGNNIVNIGATAIATVLFTGLVGDLGATVSTVVMTLLVLVFGEVIPKTLAKQSPERFAIAVAAPLRLTVVLLTPVDRAFALLRRVMARRPVQETDIQIEDELKTMVEEAQDEGDMDSHEGELIRSAIEFRELDAVSVMTPRVDITAISDTGTAEEAAELFRSTGYSRLPVYHEDMDHIIGVLHEKDFYAAGHSGCDDIRQIMTPPVFAPAAIGINRLLHLFQSSKTHMIVLLDAYGGTEGVVTMEDVLEELVGEIYDEHDDIDEELKELSPGVYSADGSMRLTELLERFGLPDDFEADTAGGLASEVLGRIPGVGDTFRVGGLLFTVAEMDRRRVTRLTVAEEAPTETKEQNNERRADR